MTLIVAAALTTGIVLILSAVNDWSLQETMRHILDGTANAAPSSPGASGQSGLGSSGQAGGGSGGGVGSW